MLRKFLEEHANAQKDSFTVFILLFNAFTWWYMIPIIIDDLLCVSTVASGQFFIIWAAYYLAIIASAIVGSVLSSKISRLKFIYFWIIFGVVISPLPFLLNNFAMISILIVGVLLGGAFGLGMPSCLAYFSDYTAIDNRGRAGGIMLLITNLSAVVFTISLSMFDLTGKLMIFTLWRATGLIIFFFAPSEKSISENKKEVSFTSILFDKPFMFYFVAWLMFCFVDRFEGPILRDFFGNFNNIMNMVGPIVGSLSALFAGILCDRIGRKRVILYGFATLGIAYAIMGIAPTETLTWYIYMGIDSISTGILWVNFLLIIWGDLSQHSSREKYYAIGVIPFFLSTIIQEYLISVPNLMIILPISAFSMAAFFLFMAVLPLLYAPETLPQKNIELRRLRSFAEDAKKAKEKYERKVKG
jgi:MFS family permease